MDVANKLFVHAACQMHRTLTDCAIFVSRETLCMLCYSLVYSRIQYGITAWATANKTSQEIIRVRLNKILRIILFRNLYTPTSQIVLKVEDIYQLELAKFMYQLHHNQLPKNFYHSFRS